MTRGPEVRTNRLVRFGTSERSDDGPEGAVYTDDVQGCSSVAEGGTPGATVRSNPLLRLCQSLFAATYIFGTLVF